MKVSLFVFLTLDALFVHGFIKNWFNRVNSNSLAESRLSRISLTTTSESGTKTDVMPGAPKVVSIDKEKNTVVISLAVPAEDTQTAFDKTCEVLNNEVKKNGYAMPGYRKGAVMTGQHLFTIFGRDTVMDLCKKLLAPAIQKECEITGLQLVGRGQIKEFHVDAFTAGFPHTLEIECDLWPEISYGSVGQSQGYRGLQVTVVRSPAEEEKFEKVKQSIRSQYMLKKSADISGYTAQLGDVIIANMRGYASKEAGSTVKGEPLPAIAKGDGVEIILETGKFTPELINALVGGYIGETKLVPITFPKRAGRGPGAALEGQHAVFEIEILDIQQRILPDWNAELAERIRPGLTVADLEKEVVQAVDGETMHKQDNNRDAAIAKKLYEIAIISQLPESILEDTTQQKFRDMLEDFAAQGATSEQLQEMQTVESYEKYKKASRKNNEKQVTLGLLFRDIAEKEKITVKNEEIQEQLDILQAQQRQQALQRRSQGGQGQDEGEMDVMKAKEEIENVLLRKKVFDFLAEQGKIDYVDADPNEQPERPAM